MSEDEAFIRAIVDNPGDDTPRLVYADWLDDHDDPRGPYLRAEHEWASTHDPSERDTLRQLAKKLDPVWVARVSRPPVGVCCDHVRLRSGGLAVKALEVDNAERQLGISFPSPYLAFLFNYNGGEPFPINRVSASGGGFDGTEPIEILRFCRLYQDDDLIKDFAWAQHGHWRRHYSSNGLLPSANMAESHDWIALDITNEGSGIHHSNMRSNWEPVWTKLADDLPALLSMLRPR